MTNVEDIINEWLDENAPEIIKDEIDVESEVEIQVESAVDKELDDIDVEEMVREQIREAIDLEKFNILANKVVKLEREHGDHLKMIDSLQRQLEDAQHDISDLILRIPQKRGWFW